MFKSKFSAIAILLILVAVLAIGANTAWAVPPIPSDYSGTVYVAGSPGGAGLIVTAGMAGWNSSDGAVTNASGTYWLGIAPPEGTSGTITFYVNGVQANETDTFNPGVSVTNFNLHVTAIPTATPNASPTPTAAANATPTATPTPTPISSYGNATVAASGGTVNTSDGKIWIEFPNGSFNASTNVTIQGGTCHPGNADFVVGSTCFNVTPGGDLNASATICVNLSAYDFSIVANRADLTLGYWANGSWNMAANVTINGTILCGQTTHLSDWAVLGSTVNSTPTPTTAPTPTITPTQTPTPTSTPQPTGSQGTNWPLVGGIVGGTVLLLVIIIIVANNMSHSRGKKSNRTRRKKQSKAKE